MKKYKVYADTSVYGGVFDTEFKEFSDSFFEMVKQGAFELYTSFLVEFEIETAPEPVKALFQQTLSRATIISLSSEVEQLQEAYLTAGILTEKSKEDALHVALATVANIDMIVSWNFKHIVHFQKIPLYNAVNTLNNYPSINIFSPREVIRYEE